MTNNIDKQSFGAAGCVFVTGATIPDGEYCAMQCVTAVTLTVSAAQAPLATGVSTRTYPENFVLYTNIKGGSISGSAVFYKALT
jgi:hypothetical protein